MGIVCDVIEDACSNVVCHNDGVCLHTKVSHVTVTKLDLHKMVARILSCVNASMDTREICVNLFITAHQPLVSMEADVLTTLLVFFDVYVPLVTTCN